MGTPTPSTPHLTSTSTSLIIHPYRSTSTPCPRATASPTMQTSKTVTARSMSPHRSVRDYIKLSDCMFPRQAPKRPLSPIQGDRPGKMRKECSGGGCRNEPIDIDGRDHKSHGDGTVVVGGKSGASNGLVADMPVGPVKKGDSRGKSNGVFCEEDARPSQDGNTMVQSALRPTDQAGPSLNGGSYRGGAGSSMKQPVLIGEGYGSFRPYQGFGPKKLDEMTTRDRDDTAEELTFLASRAKAAEVITIEEQTRNRMLEKTKEDAALEQVNTLFNSYTARAQKWNAEREKFEVQKAFPQSDDIPHTRSKDAIPAKPLLSGFVLDEPSERGGAQSEAAQQRIAGIRESGQSDSVQQHWATEVEKRKALAMENIRLARIKKGKDETQAGALHQTAESARLAKEKHEMEQQNLAEERLAAETAQLANAKHNREQNRLRKEREMNEKALLPMERSGMQKAKAANKEKSGKKVRLSKKGDDGFTATELMMIADGLEEARKRKAKEDEATKLKKDADEQASLVRRRASEAVRLARRKKLEEQIKTKTAVVVVQPLAKIKVEDPSRDDEARSALDRDRTPTQTATGRSRDRQLQNRTEQKRKAVAQGLFEAPKCDQDGVNMTPTADEDEAPISDDISSDDMVTLENELRLTKERVRKRTIQRQLLEAKAKERRVHAETSALERSAIEEDAEDNWILKRARSDEGNKQADEPRVGQRQRSCVQEDADAYNVKLQSEGRKPAMTAEERKSSRKKSARKYQLKKKAERQMSKRQNELGGTPRSTGSHRSQVSFTESEGESIDNSKEDLPMGLRAQGTSDLVPDDKAKSLKDNGNARTNEVKKLTEKQTQDGRYKIDPGPKKPAQMRNDGIHKQNM
ncbi:MAG: hypothetical protein M1830_002624, partial [Pleopsidium flavum]